MKNESNWIDPLTGNVRWPSSEVARQFYRIGDRGQNGQSGAEVVTSHGVIVYTLVERNAIGCWNTESTSYKPYYQAILLQDSELLSFPNDIKIDEEDQIWILSNNLPTFLYDQLNFNKINFRIIKMNITEMIRGTVCKTLTPIDSINSDTVCPLQ